MRIMIQAADLDHARVDGTRVYLSELLHRFGTLLPTAQFDIVHRSSFNPLLAPPTFPNYIVRSLPFPALWMQTRFAWDVFRSKPEKLFIPVQAMPLFLPRDLDVTVTVHDLAFRYYPETFPLLDRFRLRFFLTRVVHRANRIIAVSESTKRDLLLFAPKLNPEKIRVVAHGWNEGFAEQVDPATAESLLHPFSLEGSEYLLATGALQPRKNLVRLIRAFERLRKRTTRPLRLVLAGETAWLSQPILDALSKSPYRNDIVVTGSVSFETLRALYQGARVFVFPSLYEGFGIPLLEAFGSGVPVVASRNSSLEEVGGDAVLFADAENEEDIARQCERFLESESLREDYKERGKKRSKLFSWDTCARATLACIEGKGC